MKNFANYTEFAACTMNENLQAARLCLDTPKKENTNSCYGMSAIILLSSVIDTLGMFYRNGQQWTKISKQDVINNNLGEARSHFKKFYEKFMSSMNCKAFFTGKFYDFVRCRATHNNVIGPKINITKNRSVKKIIFDKKHEESSTQVYLNELYDFVKNAYEIFLKESNINIIETDQPTTGGTQERK